MKITTFLMFEGSAEAAMTFYTSLFEASQIVSMKRYGPNEAGKEGTVQVATFELNGQQFMCIDSPVSHGFTFTPAISLFVTCADEAEFDRLFAALSQDGAVLMAPGSYGFSRKFAWTNDRFKVSWQLNLE
ncbi:MAG: VOC family protein [Planctomycetales bacterium]